MTLQTSVVKSAMPYGICKEGSAKSYNNNDRRARQRIRIDDERGDRDTVTGTRSHDLTAQRIGTSSHIPRVWSGQKNEHSRHHDCGLKNAVPTCTPVMLCTRKRSF